jgi:hypothetical protein
VTSGFVSSCFDENDAVQRLTNVLDLPNQMDLTGAQLTGIIAVNKLLQIWQLRRDPEATSDHENVLTVVHGNTLPMKSTK